MISRKTTFCVRKLVSRESTASSWFSLRSCGRRQISSARKPSMDHDTVDERGCREPGQKARVFNRVPGPIPTPAQLHIGPLRAEQNAQCEKQPRDQRPLADGLDP